MLICVNLWQNLPFPVGYFFRKVYMRVYASFWPFSTIRGWDAIVA